MSETRCGAQGREGGGRKEQIAKERRAGEGWTRGLDAGVWHHFQRAVSN
ncbi:MAG: hypothetical protein LBK25_02195 [Treponema sp.]|nr:hypothetical protein [Treponema sp.]